MRELIEENEAARAIAVLPKRRDRDRTATPGVGVYGTVEQIDRSCRWSRALAGRPSPGRTSRKPAWRRVRRRARIAVRIGETCRPPEPGKGWYEVAADQESPSIASRPPPIVGPGAEIAREVVPDNGSPSPEKRQIDGARYCVIRGAPP